MRHECALVGMLVLPILDTLFSTIKAVPLAIASEAVVAFVRVQLVIVATLSTLTHRYIVSVFNNSQVSVNLCLGIYLVDKSLP